MLQRMPYYDRSISSRRTVLLCQTHRLLGEIYESREERGKVFHRFEMTLGTVSPFGWRAELGPIHFALAKPFYVEHYVVRYLSPQRKTLKALVKDPGGRLGPERNICEFLPNTFSIILAEALIPLVCTLPFAFLLYCVLLSGTV